MFNEYELEKIEWCKTQRKVNIIDNHGLLTLEQHKDIYYLYYGMYCVDLSTDRHKIMQKFDEIKNKCYCNSLPGTPCDFCTGVRK
jgi:hypothetical protein